MTEPTDYTESLKTERLNELAFSFKKTGALVLALELELFTLIDQGHNSTTALADALELDEEMVERLLTACKALELIREVDARLENFSDVSRYLVKSKPTYFGGYLIYQPISEYDSFKNLAQHYVKPTGPPPAKGSYVTMMEGADVILESNRPGTADRNGYGWSAVKARNPRIIYCALSGYGATGPLSHAPGYDLIFAAQSGMLRALTGKQVPPAPPDTYLADAVAGLTAAFAIVTALLGRERSGKGEYIDLAMHDSIFALLAVSHGVKRQDDQPASAQPATPTYDLYESKDDTCVALGAFRPASARALFEKLGRPELADGKADAALVKSFLADAFMAKTAENWVAELAPLDIEIARVNDPMEAYDDPQLRARGLIGRSTHPEAGEFDSIRQPLRLANQGEREMPGPAPRIGADTEVILKSLGLDERSVVELRKEGVI